MTKQKKKFEVHKGKITMKMDMLKDPKERHNMNRMILYMMAEEGEFFEGIEINEKERTVSILTTNEQFVVDMTNISLKEWGNKYGSKISKNS